MSNSYFNFVESADYSTALRDGFNTFNASADRAEQLERLNDETREENAGVPLKLLESIIEFSPKAAAMAEGLREKRFKSNVDKGFGDEGVEKAKKGYQALMDLGKKGNKLKNAALENKDSASYELFDLDFSKVRNLDNYVNKVNRGATESFAVFVANNLPAGPQKSGDLDTVSKAWESMFLKTLEAQGIPSKLVNWKIKPEIDKIKASFIKTQQEALSKKNLQAEQVRISDEVATAFEANDIEKINEIIKYNASFYDGNLASGTRAVAEIGLKAVELKLMPIGPLKTFLYSEAKTKGDKLRAIIDKVGSGPETTLWANTFMAKLDAAENAILDGIDEDNKLYDKNYSKKFLEFRGANPDTPPSKEEIATYIYKNPETKYDFARTGKLPKIVQGAVSEEEVADEILVPLYEKKEALGILTKGEVMKLNSLTLRNQFMPSAISANNLGMTQQMSNMSKEAIKTLVNTYTGETDGDTDKTNKWVINKQQAELLYPGLYATAIKTAETPSDAHQTVMKILTDNMYAHKYDTWGEATTRTLKLQSAVEYLQSGDKNLSKIRDNTYDKILPGFEKYIEQAMELPAGSNEVLLPFKQLGKQIGIPGSIIQLNQTTIAKLLKGEKAPIKSEVALAYEKLTDEQKTLLGKYPSQARLARAKFLAFMNEDSGEGEGVISWNELSVVHEDVGKFIYKEKTGKDLPVTPQLGKLEPRKGDWKKLPGATRIGYAVWDGEEWKYSSKRGKNSQQWIGGIEDYKDVDGYYKPFEGTSNDLTTTFFGGDEPINTAEEGGPRAGDWYKVTNKNIGAMDIGDLAGGESKPFVVWNGKEWVYSAVKGKFRQEYQGPQPLSKIEEEEKEKEKRRQNN